MKTVMRGGFFITAMLALVSAIAIAGELAVEVTAFESFVARPSVVFVADELVGSIVSTDTTLGIALLVAGSARKRARKFWRRELRADPANSNALHDRL